MFKILLLVDIAAAGYDRGIYFYSASHSNTVFGAKISGSTQGIYIADDDSDSNRFIQMLVQGNDQGIMYDNGDENTVTVSTIANNEDEGIGFSNSGRNTFHNVVSTNNDFGMNFLGAGANLTASHMAIANNRTKGISMASLSSNSMFAGVLMVGNNSEDCNVTGGTNPGLSDSTCTVSGTEGSNTYTGASLSTASLRPNRSFVSSFDDKVAVGDSVNTSDDANGGAAYPVSPSTFDWFNFESWFRIWGVSGSNFANSDHASTWTSGAGKIWNWRLLSTDNTLLNRSGDGATLNDTFDPDNTCPGATHGNVANTNQASTPITYLLNAYEIADPLHPYFRETNNLNGLCESQESCIYTPNFGAYQGHGSLGPCTFVDGTISDVWMYGYSQNGL